MRDNVDNIDNYINYEIPSFFENLSYYMNMIADGDEASIRQLFEELRDPRGFQYYETITSYIGFAGNILTSCNLATLASYLPSYDDIKSFIINKPSSNFFQLIKTLLFKDWPQDEIYPASIKDFVRRIYDTRLPIFSAVFGTSCDDKTPRHH